MAPLLVPPRGTGEVARNETETPRMSLLAGFRMVQPGRGLAAAACGRLLADVGADVTCIDPDTSISLSGYLNHGKAVASASATDDALAAADMIVVEGHPAELRSIRR